MSLEEKGFQLQITTQEAASRHDEKSPSAKRPDFGGIAVHGQTQPGGPAALTSHGRLGIPPLLINMDLDERDRDATGPALTNLSASWDPELVRRAGAALGAGQRALGINSVVLPIEQFLGDSASWRAAWRSGENAQLVADLARAFTQGMQAKGGPIALPAFFPSGEALDQSASTQMGERQLQMGPARSFKDILTAGDTQNAGDVLGVVASPGEIDGVPVVANSALLHSLLRTEWKFAGVTIAAPGAVQELADGEHVAASPAAAICKSINSGIELQWSDYDPQAFAWAVTECVRNGVISMDLLNHAVSDVLRLKFRLGLFDAAHDPAANVASADERLPADVAAESIALLRNERHLLPLAPSVKSVLILDRRGAHPDSQDPAPSTAPLSLADELRKLLPQSAISESDGKDLKSVASASKSAKAIVYLLPETNSTEQHSDTTDDPEEVLLKTILAANDHVIVIAAGTETPLFHWAARHAPALLETWSAAGSDAQTLDSALVGKINPGGRLPAPVSLADAFASDHSPAEHPDAFPLGYGLSYTTFRYSGLDVTAPEPGSKDDVKVQLSVTNTGKQPGSAVAQLYLHHDLSSVATTDRVLVAFQRVQLQAGETRNLTFLVPQREFAVWGADRKWIIEPGPYTLYAGDNAATDLSTHLTLGEPGWSKTQAASNDHWIGAPTLEMTGTPAAEFAEAYELAVRVMEYNLRDGLLEAGKGYGTWTRDTSINAWNAASLLIPDVARRTLWHQTELTPEGAEIGGQYWDKVIWIIAARNYVAITGDRAFLASAYQVALRTLTDMRSAQYDAHTGLFRGPAVYGDGVAAYPDPPFNDQHGDNVLDYSEGANLETLSTNSVYYGAYRMAAEMGRMLDAPDAEVGELESNAKELRRAIDQQLWIAADNRFGYFLDPAGKVDATQEALGEALAVTLGVASPQQAHQIFHHAQVTPWGIACTWQPFHRYYDPEHKVFGRHNGTIWPFINAFWATAASSAGEPSVFAEELLNATKLSLRSEDFREIYHPYTGDPYGGFQADKTWDSVHHQTWSATGYLRMIFQGLIGMRFEDDGIRLQPSLPGSLGLTSLTLRGLTYRQARLTITLRGEGNRVEQCKIDGVAQEGSLVPATLTGDHTVEITLFDSASVPAASDRARTRYATRHPLQ